MLSVVEERKTKFFLIEQKVVGGIAVYLSMELCVNYYQAILQIVNMVMN